MTTAAPSPPPVARDAPRIYVRDESDVRVLILALSLYSAHTHSEELGRIAESLSEELANAPFGSGYSARRAPTVAGEHSLPERS